MFAVLGLVLLSGAGWRDVSLGLPPSDDIVTLSVDGEEVWVGTAAGAVFRSRDGGLVYDQVFNVPASEPLVVPQLRNIRAATVGDLARGTEQDLEPRDQRGAAERQADLSGDVSDRPRDRSAPLLSSLVRPAARDLVAIQQIELCEDHVFIVTDSGAFRSNAGADLFVSLPLGVSESITWISCDPTRPGHIVALAQGRLHESLDAGDSFFSYTNPLSRSDRLDTAEFDSDGRLLLLFERKIYKERPGAKGYDKLCELQGDSPEAERIAWAWWVKTGEAYAVTEDGVTVCGADGMRRLPDLRLSRRRVRYLWVDEQMYGHILVATEQAVLESFDGGYTMKEIFTPPANRTIRRVMLGQGSGDVWVSTGGQIYRRVAKPALDFDPLRAQIRLERTAPLAEVLTRGLSRAGMLPGQLAQQRGSIRLRSLLPVVVLRFSHRAFAAGDISDPQFVNVAPDEVEGQDERRVNVWSAFALWDLGDLLYEPLQSDAIWADLEALRQRLTYRIEDAYVSWLRASVALEDPALPNLARARYEIVRREAAAYLFAITGGQDAFKPAS